MIIADVKGYEGYYKVGHDENGVIIINARYNRILYPRKDRDGYLTVDLYKNGVAKTCKVHRIVAEAFVYNPYPEIYKIVMHKDNNKENCKPSNLMWGTVGMNNIQAVRDGLRNNGDVLPCTKKDYIIRNPDGNNACGFIITTLKAVARIVDYDSVNACSSAKRRHTKLSKNAFAGCTIEDY